MRRYEYEKFPVAAVVTTVLGLLFAVLATSISLLANNTFTDYRHFGGLAIIEVVAAVLVLAGLTTGKVGLVRVISIILSVGTVITSFVLAIVKFNESNALYFTISLLMLIASVLSLIYFLCMRNNKRIIMMHIISSICFASLVLLYCVLYMSFDMMEAESLHIDNYFLLLSFALITILPFVARLNLVVKEVPDEEPEEEIIQ